MLSTAPSTCSAAEASFNRMAVGGLRAKCSMLPRANQSALHLFLCRILLFPFFSVQNIKPLLKSLRTIVLFSPPPILPIHSCVHITDIGVGYISTMLSLSALFLRWCTQIRDFGLQHLCSMRNLQVLSLAGCPLLTSSGLSSLIQLRHLQELELTNCPGASQELFGYLREHLPRCLLIE